MKTAEDYPGLLGRLRQRRDDRHAARLQREYEEFRWGQPDETGHIPMPLSRLKPGEQGHVLDLRGTPAVRRQLLEMGFTLGTSIDLVRVAPLADPLTVRVRGYQLSLRRCEADSIIIRRCPPETEIPG